MKKSVTRTKPYELAKLRADDSDGLALVPAADPESAAGATAIKADLEGIDWHQLAGKRVKYVREHAMNASHAYEATLMTFVIGSVEEVTTTILAGKVILSNYVILSQNPALPSLIFMACLLKGKHPCVNT